MKNILTIHLRNPIDFDVIDNIRETLNSNQNAQFLVIDTGNHDFVSIAVIKYFREQMSVFTPLLTRFKKIALIHPAQYTSISDAPEKYDYFTSQEAAFKWFSTSDKSIESIQQAKGADNEKIDCKKELKHLYQPSAKKVVAVDVPAMNFLMIDGEGAPDSQAFQDAVATLYPLAYTLKFMVKKGALEIDYGVMPLEGLWWADDMSAFTADDKDAWKWTLIIMQPELITKTMIEEAFKELKTKKNPVALPLVRFESFTEGKAAQTLHIGPFSEEGPTVEKVHDFIAESGCKRVGKHHEIYLSDIRRAAPEKWKTIIRQPMI